MHVLPKMFPEALTTSHLVSKKCRIIKWVLTQANCIFSRPPAGLHPIVSTVPLGVFPDAGRPPVHFDAPATRSTLISIGLSSLPFTRLKLDSGQIAVSNLEHLEITQGRNKFSNQSGACVLSKPPSDLKSEVTQLPLRHGIEEAVLKLHQSSCQCLAEQLTRFPDHPSSIE